MSFAHFLPGENQTLVNVLSLTFILQQEVENFKKVHLISREQFDCLTPEPPIDPNQEVPPGPPKPQQSKRRLNLSFLFWCAPG